MNAQVLQNVNGLTQLGGSAITGSALTNGFTPAASLAGGLTTPSLTVTGSVPGTVTLNDASGNLRAVFGTNDNLFGSNAITGWTFGLTNGGLTLSSNVVASVVYAKISSSGATNSSLAASAVMLTDANRGQVSLANGGANSVLHGTSPPTETALVEADFSLTDVTTANVTTSAHGFVPKSPNDATKFLNGANPPAWAVPAGGTVSPTTLTQTNFVLNTVYTNGSQSALLKAATSLTTAAVTGDSSLDLMCDQAGGTTFALLSRNGIGTTIAVTLAQTYTNTIAGVIAASATYYFTNSSAGSGNIASIIAGSGQVATIASGTNGATGATGAAGSNATVFSTYSGNSARSIGGGANGCFAISGNAAGVSDSANARNQAEIAVTGTVITNMWSTCWNATANAVVYSTTNTYLYLSTNGTLVTPPFLAFLGDSVTRVTNSGTSTITVPYGTRCCIVSSNSAASVATMQFGWSFQVLNP